MSEYQHFFFENSLFIEKFAILFKWLKYSAIAVVDSGYRPLLNIWTMTKGNIIFEDVILDLIHLPVAHQMPMKLISLEFPYRSLFRM